MTFLHLRPGRGAVDQPDLVRIWRRAVDATHDFLAPADRDEIQAKLATDYLPAVTLTVAERAGAPVGFSGVAGDGLEMLFVDPDSRGSGVGTALLEQAITEQGVRRVEVNEQNPAATGFYLHRGFEIVGRSDTDADGRAYPLLRLHLRGSGPLA